MWEAIRANKRRSVFLVFMMAAVLIVLGYLGGFAAAPDLPEMRYFGVAIALCVWVFLWLLAVAGGKGVLLSSVGAREIQHDDAPVLFNVAEEMTIASGLPKMPKVYIIDSDAPNAFAVGSPDNAAVAVTSGLLMRLNRDELQGVVAHEIGHIKNEDTKFMVLVGVMMGAIIILADAFVRGMFYSGGGRRSSNRGKGGGGAAVVLILALVFAILAPILAQILYFACSRRREYLADASSARFTRYPAGLASALEKIAGTSAKMSKVPRAVAPMFTVNPLAASGGTGLFSTHPPTADRVKILLSMGGGAAYADYESAYSRLHGDKHVIGEHTLDEAGGAVGARQASAEPEKDGAGKARDAVDILHRLGGYLFLQCACGMKIKVPPSYKEKEVQCPRCSRMMPVPVAAAAVAGMAAASGSLGSEAGGAGVLGPLAGVAGRQAKGRAAAKAGGPAVYRYKPGQWQSFRCACDHTISLSPNFGGDHVRCPGCGTEIRVERA